MKLKRTLVSIVAAMALGFSLTACFPGADSVPPTPSSDSIVPAPAPSNAADEVGQLPSLGDGETESDNETDSDTENKSQG